MHRVHTLNPSCTHTTPRPAMSRPYRGSCHSLCPAIMWPSPDRVVPVSQRTLTESQAVLRAMPSVVSPRAHARCCASCRSLLGHVKRHPVVSQGSIARLLDRVAAPALLCCGLSCDTPSSQAMRTRCRPCRRASRPYRGRCWSCRGRGLAVSWPLQLLSTALCHDTIHCITTRAGKMGSSPF